MFQSVADLKILILTDRRVWSAGGFLFFVFFIWVLTSSWREVEVKPEKQQHMVAVYDTSYVSVLGQLNKDIKEGQEERKYLRESVNRISNQVSNAKEEANWHADTLISRLNEVSNKVDKLSNKIGAPAIESVELNQRLKSEKLVKNRQK